MPNNDNEFDLNLTPEKVEEVAKRYGLTAKKVEHPSEAGLVISQEQSDSYKHKSIIDYLQEAVDNIAEKEWAYDKCPPKFTVSVLYQDKSHTIVLTVSHMGLNLSETIFPDFGMKYGYESLADRMSYLYNRTM